MIKSWLPGACRMGVYAVMALAGGAGAYDLCSPTAAAVISCSSCTVNLTCNNQGGIVITGNDVNLNGNSYWIFNAPIYGLVVNGNNAVISNLNIYNTHYDGVSFDNRVDNTTNSGTLVNVFVWMSGGQGMTNYHSRGGFSQYVNYSTFVGNDYGMYIDNTWYPGQANVYNSTLEQNRRDGIYSISSKNQTHAYNSYSTNHWDGVESFGQSGNSYYAANYANNNGEDGFQIFRADNQPVGLYNNTATGNAVWDCDGSVAGHLDVYGNTWNGETGCYTK